MNLNLISIHNLNYLTVNIEADFRKLLEQMRRSKIRGINQNEKINLFRLNIEHYRPT